MARLISRLLALAALLACAGTLQAQVDPLPSWNDGEAKSAIITFVRETTTPNGLKFVPVEARIAVFDQDGTTWVEQPMYAQLMFAFHQVGVLAARDGGLREREPFKTVLSGKQSAIARLTKPELERILVVTHSGMPAETFTRNVRNWIATAKHPRLNRLYTELVYQPMLEVMKYLRDNGYKTYLVTGGGQDFVRAYSESVYGIPPEQVVGSAADTRFTRDRAGNALLIKEPRALLIDDGPGKPVGIHLMIGRRPIIAFGNSLGDQQMLEYTHGGPGPRLAVLVLHDDANREFAYGPAQGLPDSKIGTFPQSLYDQALKKDWVVISMKNDWKRVF